jgi:hypothetical protein
MNKTSDLNSIELFIRDHYQQFTNHQLSEKLRITISAVRTACRRLGLKRMELEYFTGEMVEFLKEQYTRIGDTELATIFQQKWPKQKGWTKKHIEKKRNYLHLSRTPDQIKAIHNRNVKAGCFRICPVKAWDKLGRTPDGEIHYWSMQKGARKIPFIKINGKFTQWGRWAWQQAYGEIADGMNVVFKDGNPYNLTVDNLVLLSNAELSRKNSAKGSQALSDNYVAGILTHGNLALRELLKKNPALLELKRQQLTLNRIIYEHETNN